MISTKIPEIKDLKHGKKKIVLDLFKILVYLMLKGRSNFLVHAGYLADANVVSINCFCDENDVGILLGKKELGINTPTKWSIVRILKIVGWYAGVNDVMIRIEDYSKMKPPEGEEEAKKEQEAKALQEA